MVERGMHIAIENPKYWFDSGIVLGEYYVFAGMVLMVAQEISNLLVSVRIRFPAHWEMFLGDELYSS